MARFCFLALAGLAATAAAGSASESKTSTATPTPTHQQRSIAHTQSLDIVSLMLPLAPPLSKFRKSTKSTKSTTATTSTQTAVTRTIPAFKTFCKGDTSTTEGVQKIIDGSGFPGTLDMLLSSIKEKDWVNKLWDIEFKHDGASPLTGCGKIGSDCNPPPLCSDYLEATSYWIFRTVGILHSKVNTVRSNLLWTGWLDSLSIDQIGEDFTLPTPDTSWAAWVSAAFTMAGGAATAAGGGAPLVGMVGMASAAAAEVANQKNDGSVVDTTSVQNTLRNIVRAAGDKVADILAKATGNADPETLPIHTWTTMQYATARFFNENTLLLDENKDNSSFVATFDHFTDNLQKKLVDVALKTAWYALIANTDISEDDCTETGHLWLEAQKGTFHCFHWTVSQDSRQCKDDDPTTCNRTQWEMESQFDASFYGKLQKYGLDLKTYYNHLIDCHLNGKGIIDEEHYDNGVPRCFYNGFVMTGHWKTVYGSTAVRVLSLD